MGYGPRQNSAGAAKRRTKAAVGTAARFTLGQMTRRTCPECGPESLHAGPICCGCGRDPTASKGRAMKRRGSAGAPLTVKGARTTRGPLRAPVADDSGNLLALMRARA